MNSKQYILDNLRKNVRETYDMPDLSFEKTTYPDPVAEFIKQATTTAGAKLIEVKSEDSAASLTANRSRSTLILSKLTPTQR